MSLGPAPCPPACDQPAVELAVVIVNWNTRLFLLDALEALPAALDGLSAEVWVVDNASTDGSAEAVRAAHPAAQLILNRANRGYAAAVNQGIAASRGPYVLVSNADARPLPGAVRRLVAFADLHPRVAVVGPELLGPDGQYQASATRFPTLASELLSASGLGRRFARSTYPDLGPSPSSEPRQVDCPVGACFLVRRAAVETVGPLDESFFMYAEELDWFWRLRRVGWECWHVPAAQVVHAGGESTRQARPDMYRALYRAKVRFFALHRGAGQAAVLRVLFLALLGARWAAGQVGAARRPEYTRPFVSWSDLDPRARLQSSARRGEVVSQPRSEGR